MLEFSSTNNDCGCNPENLQQFSDPSCPAPSVVTWQSLQGKPSCFTPCAHTHVPGDIIGLEAYIQSVEFASSVTSTNSIQLTTPSGVLNANLKLSANAGTGYKVPLSILSDGLIGQIPYASGVSSGILSSTDWNIFNNKYNAPSGTVFQYVRGDGSLATFPSFVPYTGATTNVNLGTWGLTLDKLSFNTTPTQSLTGAGQLVWNNTDGTLDLRMKGNNVTLQIGQEQLTRVVNKTGADLLEANYQVVKVGGAQGNRLKVALAQANNDANSAETLGIVTETIFNNQEGFITTSGLIRGINTTGSLQSEIWNDGDMLYLSGTTAGRLTNVKPVAPIHTVIMGYVVRAHVTQGQIYVKVDNGYELDELHNVLITTPTNGQALVYESSTQLWKNQTVGMPAFTVGSVPFGNGTGLTENNSKFFWDNTLFKLKLADSKLEFLNTGVLGSALLEYKILGDGSACLTYDQTLNSSGLHTTFKIRSYNTETSSISFGTINGIDTTYSQVGLTYSPSGIVFNPNKLTLKNNYDSTGVIQIQATAYTQIDGLAIKQAATYTFSNTNVFFGFTYPYNILRFQYGGTSGPHTIRLPFNSSLAIPDGYIAIIKATNARGTSPTVTVTVQTMSGQTLDPYTFSTDYASVTYRFDATSNHWDLIASN